MTIIDTTRWSLHFGHLTRMHPLFSWIFDLAGVPSKLSWEGRWGNYELHMIWTYNRKDVQRSYVVQYDFYTGHIDHMHLIVVNEGRTVTTADKEVQDRVDVDVVKILWNWQLYLTKMDKPYPTKRPFEPDNFDTVFDLWDSRVGKGLPDEAGVRP